MFSSSSVINEETGSLTASRQRNTVPMTPFAVGDVDFCVVVEPIPAESCHFIESCNLVVDTLCISSRDVPRVGTIHCSCRCL